MEDPDLEEAEGDAIINNDTNHLKIDSIHFEPENYEKFLKEKVQKHKKKFQNFLLEKDLEVAPSVPKHYRMRCRFAIVRRGKKDLFYALYEKGRKGVLLREFPLASKPICDLMPHLLHALQPQILLLHGLRAVHFLSTSHGEEIIVELIYQTIKGVDVCGEEWTQDARTLQHKLSKESCTKIFFVGRSKGKKNIIEKDFVQERLSLVDGRVIKYKQILGSFSNPNASINICTLEWLCRVSSAISSPNSKRDLLELYCGNANHSCALAGLFRQALLVEIDADLVDCARANLVENQVQNAIVLKSPSQECCRLILKGDHRRLQKRFQVDLQDYDFSTVIVDPPRAGLDKETLELVAKYDNVLYVSCNPESLYRDLQRLQATHTLESMIFLDHFPYTLHCESAVFLCRM